MPNLMGQMKVVQRCKVIALSASFKKERERETPYTSYLTAYQKAFYKKKEKKYTQKEHMTKNNKLTGS